jgi:hypothetical protein
MLINDFYYLAEIPHVLSRIMKIKKHKTLSLHPLFYTAFVFGLPYTEDPSEESAAKNNGT